MKQWMLSVHHVEGEATPTEDQMQQMFTDVDAFNREVQAAGAWVFACGLEAPDVATVVRHDGGEVVTTDGPFAESKEHLGGFWVIKAPDLDAALEWAAKGAGACQGPVEVRPLQDESED